MPWGKPCPGANSVTEGRGETGNACVPHRMLRWCQCGIDRQWREAQSSWSSRGCPHLTQILCYPSKHTHTHPSPSLQYNHPAADSPLTPFPPPFSSFRRLTAPPDMQGTPIILFPIINPCCVYTMGPKAAFRQQRKHLLLSRQGTNTRILQAISYIPPVTSTHKHRHIHIAYVQTCRR